MEYAGLDQGLGAAVDDVWGWEGGLGDADVVYRGWDRLPGDPVYHLNSLSRSIFEGFVYSSDGRVVGVVMLLDNL